MVVLCAQVCKYTHALCICVHVCAGACMCVCRCIHMCAGVCAGACRRVRVCRCACSCACMSACMCVCRCVHECMQVCVQVRAGVCRCVRVCRCARTFGYLCVNSRVPVCVALYHKPQISLREGEHRVQVHAGPCACVHEHPPGSGCTRPCPVARMSVCTSHRPRPAGARGPGGPLCLLPPGSACPHRPAWGFAVNSGRSGGGKCLFLDPIF